MTVKEAIKYIILKSEKDKSLLTDTKHFWELLNNLSSEYKKELNVIKRSLDSDFLELCFNDKDEIKQRALKMKYMLEDQGVGENWIDFIVYSFFSPLGWEPSNDEDALLSQQIQEHKTWICSCGTVNNGNFCGNCGTAKSVLKSLDWTCSCGSLNTTNFCTNCGKPQKGQKQQVKQNRKKQVNQLQLSAEQSENANYIEVTLDKKVLKHLGYQVKCENKGEVFDSLISLKKNRKDVTNLDIPSTYIYNGKNYKITEIGYGVFANSNSLINVTIPDSVKQINSFAFAGCLSLKSVTIPNSVVKIGYASFADCMSLINVTIPDSVTLIFGNAFWEVPHIEYHGASTGAPWGAKDII